MNKAIAAHRRWPIWEEDGSHTVTRADDRASGAGRGVLASMAGLLGDAFLLLLVVWLFPVALLLLGMPLAILLRLLAEATAML